MKISCAYLSRSSQGHLGRPLRHPGPQPTIRGGDIDFQAQNVLSTYPCPLHTTLRVHHNLQCNYRLISERISFCSFCWHFDQESCKQFDGVLLTRGSLADICKTNEVQKVHFDSGRPCTKWLTCASTTTTYHDDLSPIPFSSIIQLPVLDCSQTFGERTMLVLHISYLWGRWSTTASNAGSLGAATEPATVRPTLAKYS